MSGDSLWAVFKKRFPKQNTFHQFLTKTAIETRKLVPQDIETAYDIFKKEFELEDTDNELETYNIEDYTPPTEECEKVILENLAELKNINALPEDAIITFHPQLTIIYGMNGVGKSGFARFLKSVCFSRTGEVNIEPNAKTGSTQTQEAKIKVTSIDLPIACAPNEHLSQLRQITFFDSTIANHLISKPNQVEFVPQDLDILDIEIEGFDALLDKLNHEILKKSQPDEVGSLAEKFTEESEIATAIINLNAQSQYSFFETKAQITDEDIEKEKVRQQDIKQLTKDQENLQSLEGGLNQFDEFIKKYSAIANRFNEPAKKNYLESAATLNNLSDEFRKSQTSISIDISQFEEQWRNFIQSGSELSDSLDKDYSKEEECILCGQEVKSDDAKNRILKFWAYIKSDISSKLNEFSAEYEKLKKEIEDLVTDICSPSSAVRQFLSLRNPELLKEIDQSIKELEKCRTDLIQFLSNPEDKLAEFQFTNISGKLALYKNGLETSINEIKNGEVKDKLTKLRAESTNHNHSIILQGLLPRIKAYIENQVWIEKAEESATKLGTKNISTLKGKLIKELLDNDYSKLLNEELDFLGFSHLSVKVPAKVSKQDNTRSLKLMINDTDLQPSKILSEGEQKALALSDFLSSLKFNPEFCGAIFDDPVTSLDHTIRKRVAKRLVAESKERQIIIFTHDLSFLNQLNIEIDYAGLTEADYYAHWVDKVDDCPGVVSLNYSPIVESKLRDPNDLKLSSAKKQKNSKKDAA